MSEPVNLSETSTTYLQYQLLDLDEGIICFAATGVSIVPSPMFHWPRSQSQHGGRTIEPWTQDGRHHGYNAERDRIISETVWGGVTSWK